MPCVDVNSTTGALPLRDANPVYTAASSRLYGQRAVTAGRVNDVSCRRQKTLESSLRGLMLGKFAYFCAEAAADNAEFAAEPG